MAKTMSEVLDRIGELERTRVGKERGSAGAPDWKLQELFDFAAQQADFDDQHDYTRYYYATTLGRLLPRIGTTGHDAMIAAELGDRVPRWLLDDVKHSDPVVRECGAIAALALLDSGHLVPGLARKSVWGAVSLELRRALSGDPAAISPRVLRAGVELNVVFSELAALKADPFSQAMRAVDADPELPWWDALPGLIRLVNDASAASKVLYIANCGAGSDRQIAEAVIRCVLGQMPADKKDTTKTRLTGLVGVRFQGRAAEAEALQGVIAGL